MKIAIVNEVWTAGATRCAVDLARGIADRGHEVIYFPRTTQPETPDGLISALGEFKPDLVHLHSFFGDLPYDFLAKISHKYPTFFTPHDPRPIGAGQLVCWQCERSRTCFRCPLVSKTDKLLLRNPYYWERLRKRRAHRRAAASLTIISPSQWLQGRLQSSELQRFEMHHLPYGINLDLFRPMEDSRSELSLSGEGPVLLYVAHCGPGWHLNDRKGLAFLADAFVNDVAPRFPDAILLVAGEKLVPNHPQVRGLGSVSQTQLPLYYNAADVFVAPTLADNLPYTILEAMGCGTAVVASDVGGISEEVVNGETGALVPARDSAALGGALISVLSDLTRCRELGKAGRARAEQLFGMTTFIDRHEQLYRAGCVGRVA